MSREYSAQLDIIIILLAMIVIALIFPDEYVTMGLFYGAILLGILGIVHLLLFRASNSLDKKKE